MTNTQQNQRPQDVLVWTDIETTGLDPERDVVLEVGMIATDYELRHIPDVDDLHLVVHPSHAWLRWRRMSEFARHMHASNHLLDDCLEYGIETSDAAIRMTRWLAPLHEGHGRLTFAGSSVAFDRSFIRRMRPGNPLVPAPIRGFGHRVMDVSVLDMLAEHLYPDVYAHRPERTTNHRVMACLHDSMALYRYYRERLVCGSVVSGVSDCSDGVSGVQDGPVMGGSGVSASAWDEGYQIGLGDGLHGTRNVNPYRGKES
jgi:oligoribonuclease